MRKGVRTAGALLLTTAALTALPAALPTGLPTATAQAGQRSAAGAEARSVTLVTGDRVTVLGPDAVLVQRGEGREGVMFHTRQDAGRLRVVPDDALPLLRAGRLDERLFDVTTLLEYGYDDRRGSLPLIVTGAERPASLAGGRSAALPAVGGYAVQEERAQAARFWRDLAGSTGRAGLLGARGKVWLDGLRKVSLDQSVKQIGAPDAWARGHTGKGVKVAVLDTGVDATHPDLAGKVVARRDFTEEPDERDVVGHGTHVASTIAGSGAASGGRYRGVAPDAALLDGRVCESVLCSESAILAGMQWAAEQGAQVVNLSLGIADTPETDPIEQAVQTLTERYGTLFVVAAGNIGDDRSVSSPASAEAALAVGAVTKSDELASFSSRGPRVGDGGLKPDITAPGAEITAARSKDSPGSGSYVAKSGTSMATPHVAGVAALLAGEHPGWKAGTLKAALMGSAKPGPTVNVYGQGAGRVDAARATLQNVTAEPAGIGFPRQEWPHGDDEAVTRKLVYRNHSDTPLTLTLGIRAGEAFTVSPDTIVVPAGGTAEATVTADTSAGGPDGFLGGYVVASGAGGVSVSTPVAVEKEVESYNLTIRHTNRAGVPTGDFEASIVRLDAEAPPIVLFGGAETTTLRLPKGRWLFDTTVLSEDGVTLLVQPELRLDADRTVDADARLGRPLDVTAPSADAKLELGQVVYQWRGPGGTPLNRGWLGSRFDRMFTAQLGPDRDYEGLLTMVAAHWAGADTYRMAWFERGRVVTGFRRDTTRERLATVRTDFARHLPDATARAASRAWPRDGKIPTWLTPDPVITPSVRTEHVNTGDGIRWQRYLWEYGADGRVNQFESAFHRYPPGRVTTEWWNRGVFGPSLPAGDQEGGAVSRVGDVISADLWMFGDGRGSLGWSSRATEHLTLYRDGERVGEAATLRARFEVPAGEAGYRLVAEAERGAPAVLGTRVSAAWTFRSATAPDGTVRLPVSVVTFTPALNAENAAPAGRLFTVPFSVRPQPGGSAGRPRETTVEVSYDDGATWAKTEVKGSRAVLRHPAGDGFVSLRARSRDLAGNTVEQTVIRAYRIVATG
ncbi:S8 family serine peptidase [Nonomuraea angiospora]|uniref:Subtilisin family serine protease n=1 Tax=Nonomuraea angiospora TaxID=46172 RepID=A0ABR9LNB7_9ACTN|nr:S8 family serine peptidase [Nonomuraea angiospora]MBE1582158.1 subtilisin family serine protease [Nonomuraea angiospora]